MSRQMRYTVWLTWDQQDDAGCLRPYADHKTLTNPADAREVHGRWVQAASGTAQPERVNVQVHAVKVEERFGDVWRPWSVPFEGTEDVRLRWPDREVAA